MNPQEMTEMTQNNYIIREADESDFPNIAEFCVRHSYSPIHPDWSREEYLNWLKWKFLNNPDGPGRMFIIEDSKTNVVGMRGDVPRLFSGASTGTFVTYQGVDLLVDSGLREKGLYSRLRQFAWSNLDLPKVSFPSKQVRDIICRHGFQIIAPGEKWYFPIAVGKSTSGKPFRLVAPLYDIWTRLYAFIWLGGLPRDLEMKQARRFGRDFEVDPAFIHGVRSAKYLNWRFIDNPMYDYAAFHFLEKGAVIGYCVYTLVRSKAEVYDFVVARRQRKCLRLLVQHCRGLGVTQLRFRGIGLNMRKFGLFLRRDRHTYYAGHEVPEGSWLITTADRDY
jgi:hypothetical protein